MSKRRPRQIPKKAADQNGFRSVWIVAPASVGDATISPSRNKGDTVSIAPYRVLQVEGGGRTYAPTEHAELPGTIAKLHRGSETDIVNFASAYGPLGRPQLIRGTGGDWVDGDPIPWVLTHSRTLDFVMRAANMLSRSKSERYVSAAPEDYTELLQTLAPPAAKPLFYESWVKWVHPERPKYLLFSDPRNRKADVLLPTVTGYRGYIKVQYWNIAGPPWFWRDILSLMVRDTVNANISGIVHALAPDDRRKGHDQVAMQFSALIEVAYWLVANAISDDRVGKCEAPGCGSVFIQEDRRQRFCPPGPEKRESPCAIRARVAEHRRQKKSESAGQGANHGTKRR